MIGEVRYYRGIHKVRVVTQSEGHWIVEALENFDDCVNEEKIVVKVGDERIVPPNLLFKSKTLPPMVKEHSYELKMEKDVQRMIFEDEKKKTMQS